MTLLLMEIVGRQFFPAGAATFRIARSFCQSCALAKTAPNWGPYEQWIWLQTPVRANTQSGPTEHSIETRFYEC